MSGKAIAALVLGIIAICLFLLWMVAGAIITATFGSMTEEEIYAYFGIDPSEIPAGYAVIGRLLS